MVPTLTLSPAGEVLVAGGKIHFLDSVRAASSHPGSINSFFSHSQHKCVLSMSCVPPAILGSGDSMGTRQSCYSLAADIQVGTLQAGTDICLVCLQCATVSIFMSPPNSYVDVLTPRVMVLDGGAFGR